MALSELEHALDVTIVSSPAKRLALAHITFAKFLDDILQCGALKPTDCEVFSNQLLYFSYGVPRYKPSWTITEVAAEFPVAIVLKPSAVELMDCFYPYDTGAAYYGLFGEPWSGTLKQFDRFRVSKDPTRLVSAFYETNENFMRGKVARYVNNESPLPLLHDFLCQDLSGFAVDLRQRTIECVASSSIGLCEKILWVGFPDFLTPKIDSLYERCSEGFAFDPYMADVRESPTELVTMLSKTAKQKFRYLFRGPSAS